MKKETKLIILTFLFFGNINAQQWSNVGGGLSDNIYDLISYNGYLYSSGRHGFTLNEVNFWDGENWNETNTIFGISTPLTMEIFEDELYTSGDFSGSNGSPTRVYKLQDEEWIQQGPNFTAGEWNSVKKLKQFGNYLYAAGQFEKIDSVFAKNIARWDGQQWEKIGEGLPDIAWDMHVFQNQLLVRHSATDTVVLNGNTFYTHRSKMQILDNDSWVDLDSTFDYKNVRPLGVINDELYFASTDTIHNLAIQTIGTWDGTNITSIGDSLFYSVGKVIQYNNEVYASSIIILSNPTSMHRVIRKWDSENWTVVGGDFDDGITTLHKHDNDLYIGGFFEEYDDNEMKFVSKYNGLTNLVEKIDPVSISLYPNPTISDVIITSNYKELQALELYSLTGRHLKSWVNLNQKEFSITLNNFPNDIYLISITLTDGTKTTKRLVKNSSNN